MMRALPWIYLLVAFVFIYLPVAALVRPRWHQLQLLKGTVLRIRMRQLRLLPATRAVQIPLDDRSSLPSPPPKRTSWTQCSDECRP